MKFDIKVKVVGASLHLDQMELEALSNVCEAARCYIGERLDEKFVKTGAVGQFTEEQVQAMENVMRTIFDIADEENT